MSEYVHGYSALEAERLNDQADSLAQLIHHDSIWNKGALILEAGCGVGAQTKSVALQKGVGHSVILFLKEKERKSENISESQTSMLQPLIDYFQKHLHLEQEEKEYLLQHIPVVEFEKHSLLLKEGQISTSFFFLIEGCVRMFYLVDGKEKTTFFYFPGDFVSAYESYTKQAPSKHYFETSQKSKIAVFSIDTVQDILKRYPRFELLARIAMEAELSIYQEMIASFVTLNAEQRYIQLLKKQADLLQKIPQYHIATYLGVSPETLSRIRQRLAQKGIN